MEYVQCKYPFVDNHASAQILDLVGGHFAHLNQAAMRLKSGVSFEQMHTAFGGERTRQIGNSANTLQNGSSFDCCRLVCGKGNSQWNNFHT